MPSIRFIPLNLHGILDYAVAATLIAAPFVLDFAMVSPFAHWFSIVAGAGLVAYSLLTDYSLSARAVISFRIHLALDFIAGAAFVVAPFAAGFDGAVRWFYLVVGAAVMAVVLTSKLDKT